MVETSLSEIESSIAVYFLGSGLLAVPVLQKLHRSPLIRLVGLGTQPDRPSGRRRLLTPTEVGSYAETRGWAVDKPESVNSPDFLAFLARRRPEIVVVVAFGQILKDSLLNLPPHGCLNVHASLLPAHRGAAPVAAAILNGDRQSGISFMRMDQGLDTGPIYAREKISINPDETSGELESRLAELAAQRIVGVVVEVCRRGRQPVAQDQRQASYAGKLNKQAGQLDWSGPANFIDRCIRAFEPWPRVVLWLPRESGGKRIQIVRAQPVELPKKLAPGTICRVNRHTFSIACGDGGIEIKTLIPEGGRRMSAADFMRGNPLREGLAIISHAERQPGR